MFLLSGCTHYYYAPNSHNVPLFIEKNEFRISGSMGGGDESSLYNIQSAYSITDHIAVMVNYLSAKGGDTASNSAKGNYLEGAVGYYIPFKKIGVFEVYGGFGGSKQHHEYLYFQLFAPPTYIGLSDLSFTKIFLQPSFGLTFKAFDVALSSRLCRLSYDKINNQTTLNSDAFKELELIARNKVFYLAESGITIRGGWKYIKVQLQILSTKNLSNDNLPIETMTINLGLYFSIGKRFLQL